MIVLGPAKADDWPGSRFQQGDLEGIVWTTPRQVTTVVNNLRGVDGVVDARGECDPPPSGVMPIPSRRR
jgi:hypothetical protein